ncbi:tyrosine-type recombinase/integrase [Pseudomonas fulva]|uniref:tyrosine-type recombinase/integrase n=1 Tax=Pseudomonas fulva TaxID=47880 RepID=UPI001F43627C|nr:site-specific integrase [Pseudomonas fulva]
MSLSQTAIPKISQPGRYQDKNGLYLNVTETLSKNWVYRYQINGRRRDKGLGSFPEVSVMEARKKLAELKALVARGIDPLDEKQMAALQVVTFEQAARSFIERYRAAWSPTHASQWASSMENHVYPKIGNIPVNKIDTDDILPVLEPIWRTIPESARRIRNRIEQVLDAEKTLGHRDGPNPARWRGHLQNLLDRGYPVAVPLESLDYHQLPEFWLRLDSEEGRAARCLQFLILTGTRTNEAMAARWDEIDFERMTWTIPAERMKNREQHVVPLSEEAIQVLKETGTRGSSFLIFPGRNMDKLMADNSLRRLLKKMDMECTPHGFRATFRTWAQEQTKHESEVCEAALSHEVGNAVSKRYMRGTQLEKRRLLMDDWGQFATNAPRHAAVQAVLNKAYSRARKHGGRSAASL